MFFNYEAYRKGGERVFGTIDAENKDRAAYQLYQQELIVTRIVPLRMNAKVKVKEEELIFFTRLLSTAINASVPLTRALEITAGELSVESQLRNVVTSLLHELKTGKSLSDSLAMFRGVFNDLYVNMVRAGERAGKLGQALQDVQKYTQKRYEMKKKIGTSLLYPSMIMIFAVIVLVFFTLVLIPQFKDSYSQFGSELPAMTTVLIDVTDWIKANIILLAALVAAAVSGIRWAVTKTEPGRVTYEKFLFILPVVGEMVRKDAVARMSRTLSVLIQNGIPLVDALELTRGVVGFKVYEWVISAGVKSLTQGGKLTDAFKGNPYIPSIFIQITAMGEESGKVGELMESLSDFYEKEVDNSIEKITSVITPVMIVFIGLIIGIVVVALFLPIFNLSNVIK